MQDALEAYLSGRDDGIAGTRDNVRTQDPATGADYRIGFLDGRVALFHIHAEVRRWLAEEAD